MESLYTMLTFPPVVSAPYEARQPFVQPEGPSLGGQGAKPPRHQASLIRVSDVGLCQWETLGTWLCDEPSFFFFRKEDIKLFHANIVLLALLFVYFPKSFFFCVCFSVCLK